MRHSIMKRFAVYVKDESGHHTINGETYLYVTQVPGEDKAKAMEYVHSHDINKGKGFVVKYVGKWS